MATTRPLRLVSQRNKSFGQQRVVDNLFSAEVLVDTPVFHLADVFTYAIPENLLENTQTGSLVKVPFGSGFTLGYIRLVRPRIEADSSLKSITEVLSVKSLVSEEIFTLVEKLSKRYATTSNDLLRSAIPPRVAAVDKRWRQPDPLAEMSPSITVKNTATSANLLREIYGEVALPIFAQDRARAYVSLPIAVPQGKVLAALIMKLHEQGPTLVLLPDQKELDAVSSHLLAEYSFTADILTSSLSKSDRYLKFLTLSTRSKAESTLCLGTRSAIFAPLAGVKNILIVNEQDSSFYEQRTPFWNVRDVGLLRSENEKCGIIFAGYSPSLEIARMEEEKWLIRVEPSDDFTSAQKIHFTADEPHDRLNESSLKVIREGLKKGGVLVSVGLKGYQSGFLCNQCRNLACCSCGGKLHIPNSSHPPTCSICAKSYREWRCSWCGASRRRDLGKGSLRRVEELGKAFPRVRVISSTSDHLLTRIPEEKVIVIATLGAEPEMMNGYAAIIFLDGERIFSRPTMRGDEEGRYKWSSQLSLAKQNAEIYLSLAHTHREVQALLLGDGWKAARAELKERAEVNLPPYSRMISIEGSNSEMVAFAMTLRESESITCEVLGPVLVDKEKSKIVIRVDFADAQKLLDVIKDVQRYRSVKNKGLFRVHVDPFEI